MAGLTSAAGIILSASPIGEYDRRLVILTRELGKISAFARGARKMNSPLLGVTQPLVFGVFELYEGRTSFSLKTADIKNYFRGVSQDLDATLFACYFAEIAEYYGKEGLDASDSINLLYAALMALEKKQMPFSLIRSVYEIRAIKEAGELPDLTRSIPRQKGDAPDLLAVLSYTIAYCVRTPLKELFSFTLRSDAQERLTEVCHQLTARTFEWPMRSAALLPK